MREGRWVEGRESLEIKIDGGLAIEVAGERVILLAHRAAFWVAARTLLVADLHLDKCEAMRVSGMPVPRGVVEEQVGRLDEAVRVTGARRVLILGDLLHAPGGVDGGDGGAVSSVAGGGGVRDGDCAGESRSGIGEGGGGVEDFSFAGAAHRGGVFVCA